MENGKLFRTTLTGSEFSTETSNCGLACNDEQCQGQGLIFSRKDRTLGVKRILSIHYMFLFLKNDLGTVKMEILYFARPVLSFF